MKIALCTEIMYPLYGVERRVYELGMRLPKYGVDVEIYTSTSRDHFKKLKIIKVSHTTITNPPKRNYAFCIDYTFNLFKQLMKRDYDLVHAEGHMSLIPCSAAAFMRKKPSVATIHDLYLSHWSKMYKSVASVAGIPFEVLSCKMPFGRVLTVNSSIKNKMINILKIDRKKIDILHSGIDTKYIDSIKNGKKDDSIVYVGRLVPQKNVSMLIRAYASLSPEVRKKHQLKIIGEGSEKQKLEVLAKNLGVAVNFVGKIERHEDVIREVKAASLFVLPSRRESFGITIMESMLSGVPVISTATEGPMDHIVNGETGFLVGIDDSNELAKRMEQVLSGEKLYGKLSKNGRSYAMNHDWESIAKNVASVYKKVYESR